MKLFVDYYGLKDIETLSLSQPIGYYFDRGSARYERMTYRIDPVYPVGFKGKIYLLVDDYVYSAAEAFAVFAKSTGWATLIGTVTGGDGIGYDSVPVALPNSGLIIRFPMEMGLNPDGSINEETAAMPHIYVEPSYEDYLLRNNMIQRGEPSQTYMQRIYWDTV